MIDYPYDFGNGYKVQTVFANRTADGAFGDIYDFRSDAIREHPGADILKGYCVIDVVAGLVPVGCNDWNDTISAAIQDYEDHILPILEREEAIELNYSELDTKGNLIRETLFTVKSGWLQDYLGVDNRTQLEALLTNSDEWDAGEILKSALNEPGSSGCCECGVTEYGREDTEAQVYILFNKIKTMRKNPRFQIASDMAYIQDMIELDEPLSDDDAYVLASKLDFCFGSFFVEPLLHEEYLDALRYMLEYGLNKSQSPEFPELSAENTRRLLISADNQTFGTLVEVVAINNRDFYSASYPKEDIASVLPVIEAAQNKKALLCEKIIAARESVSPQNTQERGLQQVGR